MVLAVVFKVVSGILRIYYSFIGLKIAKDVFINGFPIIKKVKSAEIIIGRNVTINSRNRGYHLNMHSPCKLVVDKPNSVITIGENTRIHGTCIHAFQSIRIGKNCLIAANSQIIDANGHMLSFDNPANRFLTKDEGKPVVIEDNVWIATNCIILGGTTIGQGSIIVANSVVKGNVPPNCIYGGNPAKLIKQYS
ncbi:acyltransferase [Pontibacter sp. H249]|uniref:acyltransferase n=1 Tax=Pontibacter sp. H249 TaxID=3133420 RepID=UPI0030BCED45